MNWGPPRTYTVTLSNGVVIVSCPLILWPLSDWFHDCVRPPVNGPT